MRRLLVAGAVLLSAVFVAGCGDDGDDSGGSPFVATAEAVCEASRTAADDPDRAETIFLDRAHDSLHDLAAEVEAVDRGVAARLLTAKQRVEDTLHHDGEADATLAADLEALFKATEESLAQLDVSPPGCR